MKNTRIIILAVIVAVVGIFAAGCGSAADTASTNISKEAEKFHILRRIVGVNGITDKVEFEVVGLCSIERDGDLVVTCKEGPGKYKKHYFGLSDNTFFINTQLKTVNVSEYRTKIVFRPESIIPDVDLVTGEQATQAAP